MQLRLSLPGRLRRRWKVWHWAALGTAAALGGYLYSLWIAPYCVMRQFVGAVEARDAGAIVALSYPPERGAEHLTPAVVEAALTQVFPGPARLSDSAPAGQPDGGHGGAARTTPAEGTVCLWTVFWVDGRTGRPLPGRWHILSPYPSSQLWSPVILKPTGAGWRVLVGAFLEGTCRSEWGRGLDGKQAFVTVARQSGLTGYLDSDNSFEGVDVASAPH